MDISPPTWLFFFDEVAKIAAKSPTSLKIPDPRTNLKGMERFTGNPGKTLLTDPSKSLVNTSGMGQALPIGRTGTSATPTPLPLQLKA